MAPAYGLASADGGGGTFAIETMPGVGAGRVAIGIAAVGTVLLGLLPGWWYSLLEQGQNLLVYVALR